jgi:hypothetical protein
MATRQSTHRRLDLALTECEALTVNFLCDVRALEARLSRNVGLAVLAYPELRILEAGAECLRAELGECRTAMAVELDGAAKMSKRNDL